MEAPENTTQSSTHFDARDGTHRHEQLKIDAESDAQGHAQSKSPVRESDAKKPIIDVWRERDEWIRLCVGLGMNANQISILSLSWPQPMQAVRHVYDKIESLGLQKEYSRGAKRRSSVHSRNIIEAFMKLSGQAFEYGLPVKDVLRGAPPAEGARVKPDLGLRIGDRQFYVEVQVSRIQFTRWGEKIRRHLSLYKLVKRPFRSLIIIDADSDLSYVRGTARRVLHQHPDLNLFYFLTWNQFVGEQDVLKAPIWLSAWDAKKRFSLM